MRRNYSRNGREKLPDNGHYTETFEETRGSIESGLIFVDFTTLDSWFYPYYTGPPSFLALN